MTSGNPLLQILREEIRRTGPITCAQFMEHALYHELHGYYRASARKPGRGGDFITAPELHPLFGLALAKQVIECWQRMGSPTEFTIREYGSGVGGLAYDVLAGVLNDHPELRSGLRYELVEVNPHRRNDALQAMHDVGLDDVVVALEKPADSPMTGVVLANEFLDAMPVHRLLVRNGSIQELFVSLEGDDLAWTPGKPTGATEPYVQYLNAHEFTAATWEDGDEFEYAPGIADWFSEIAQVLESGYVICIDYGYPVEYLWSGSRKQGTLRSFSEHTVSGTILEDPGERDITAHVDFTLVREVAEHAGLHVEGFSLQADFLARIGLGDLLVNMQQDPDMTLDVYYRAQAAVYRLIDPGGMGNFRVTGFSKGVSAEPMMGFDERGL